MNKQELVKVALGALLSNPNVTKEVFSRMDSDNAVEEFAQTIVDIANSIATKAVRFQIEKDGPPKRQTWQ